MKNLRKLRGFTLIELLVVVAIIALLAVGVFPLYSKIMLEMKAKSAMRSAYQIHQALFAYASNHDQVFPNQTADGGDFSDSNTAYRQLFVAGLMDDEKLFFVQGSAWHGKMTKADGDLGTADDGFSQALSAGENHWGYVSGLASDRDDSTLPIVMDGGVDGSPGKYSKEPKDKGGVWKGRYAIAVRIGGAAKVYELNPSELTIKDKKSGSEVDIFSDAYGTNTANLLNPMSN
jgi:prepilin-type N-terminal cleavage/methylation domain-containing protein